MDSSEGSTSADSFSSVEGGEDPQASSDGNVSPQIFADHLEGQKYKS